MKTAKDIQEHIFTHTGLKTSVKQGKGSMKGYTVIWPIFQSGTYPNLPFDYIPTLRVLLAEYGNEAKPVFCSVSEIAVPGLDAECVKFKKEAKPKPVEDKPVRSWGSKNSQLRLDKATARYAAGARRGRNQARYY